MIIDKNTGEVHLYKDFVIGPHTTLEEFDHSLVGGLSQRAARCKLPGTVAYTMPRAQVGENTAYVDCSFTNEEIYDIGFSIGDANPGPNAWLCSARTSEGAIQ